MLDSSVRPGILRRVIRWVPLVTLVGVAALLSGSVLRGGMVGAVAWFYLLHALPLLGACVLIGTLVYAAWKRRLRSPAVLATLAVSLLAIAPFLAALYPIAFPASLESRAPAATVRLPANVPLKVAWGGDEIRTNMHVALSNQRWGYDLTVEPFFLESSRLEDYGCYGVPVVAPASGVVSGAHDGEPDATPGVSSNNSEAPCGNYVAIRLDSTGTYLAICHLKPGSVAVKAGERVTEGEVIGQCGNSGNTSEPHIHIHHQRQDPARESLQAALLGIAEGLPLYFRDHDGEPMPTGGLEERDGKVVALGATVRHVGGSEKSPAPAVRE